MSGRRKEINLKKLDGILAYSIISGFMLSILIFTGIDASETGIAINILETVANTLGSPSPYLVPIIAISVTIIELIIIASNIIKIAEHGYAGVVVSGTGFFGTLAVFSGTIIGVHILTYMGIGMWIVGQIIVRRSEDR